MKKTIAVLPGDGVGPEVIEAAIKVIEIIEKKFNHQFEILSGLIGASAIEKTGCPLPKETIEICNQADAILFGAIGNPKYDLNPNLKVRPEQGLLQLRKQFGLYANLRPIKVFSSLIEISPLKADIIKNVDFIIVRELTGGAYFGKKEKADNYAKDEILYTKEEIERIFQVALNLAKQRKRKITLVDKANVLETSRLWRNVIINKAIDYLEIDFEYMYVDNAAMQIIKNPKNFDVILTENMFGDILTDEAAMIVGSIGLLPSASIGKDKALYEPIHGSYPKAAGKNTVNPTGAILSVAMMFEYSFSLKEEANIIYQSLEKVFSSSIGTKDLKLKVQLSTTDFIDQLIKIIKTA